MSLTIVTFPAGPVETNAYLVIDDASKHALIVDAPIGVSEELLAAAEKERASIDLIYITHSHWDHIGDAASLRAQLGVPVLTHALSAPGLTSPGTTLFALPFEIAPVVIDRLVAEGDSVEVGETVFSVMHLPGHEPGHTALYSEPDRVFLGGDVLFPNGHGRIDLPGSSERDMAASLRRLADLPGNVKVYPGHGLPTTIDSEPWLQGYR